MKAKLLTTMFKNKWTYTSVDNYGSSSEHDKILNTQRVKLESSRDTVHMQTRLAKGIPFMCGKIIKRNIPITATS